MATINKSFVSDAPTQNVRTELRKRVVGGSAEYFAIVEVRFNGNRGVTKEVLLSELSPSERTQGLAFYSALHAAALAKVVEGDF